MIPAGDDVQKIHSAGSSVEDLDPLRNLVALLQRLHHANTDPLVGKKDVAGAEYQNARKERGRAAVAAVRRCERLVFARHRHSALTRTISPPAPSSMWMAHARQGSNEWTVRITSSGFSGSATGLPISEAS